MKKRLFALFFVLLFTFSLVLAQLPDGFGESADGVEADPDSVVDSDGNKISGGLIQERETQDRQYSWDSTYEQLLKNENVAAVDNVFRNNDLVFRTLFGVPYEFSGTMLLIFILWFCTLLFLPDLIDSIDFFNKITSWIAGLLIVIVLAQAQFFRVIVNVGERLIFFTENQWIRVLLFILVIVLFVMWYYVGRAFTDYLDKMKKDREEKDLKENTVAIDKDTLKGQREGEDFSKKMIEGMTRAGKKK